VKKIIISDSTSCTVEAIYSFRYSKNKLRLFRKVAVTDSCLYYFWEVEIEFSNVMQLIFRRQNVLRFHLPGGTEGKNEDKSLAAETKFCV
jgi:hypothetical protein